VIWFLQTFNLRFSVVTDSKDSILAGIAGLIAPIFAPLGFGDWRISTALISGFMAKESVVSTITVLFGTTEALRSAISVAAASGLLVFCLLYTPCVAAVAAVRRELGKKWALFMVLAQCGIAWVFALLTSLLVGIF
jgi:ferrous iron transport protein B